MKTVCEKNLCIGCMACVISCPKDAIEVVDDFDKYNAIKNMNKCIECGICTKVCQKSGDIIFNKPVIWYQGWAVDKKVRRKGASGGVATALSISFIENGGLVCGCVFKNGEFCFEIIDNKEEVYKFTGSKYVKSNLKDTYRLIKDKLHKKKVLFIGLPCQVAALKKYIGENEQNNLYTVDLICHGTPSPKVLDYFLNQQGYNIKDVKNIRFRDKGQFQLCEGDKGIITTGVCDSYLLSFLNGICYTENCYKCDFAKFERVSDITLGDSWGTNLSIEEQKKGISLILCQNERGKKLVNDAKLILFDVDINNAVANNSQLSFASKMPSNREAFFEMIRKKKNYSYFIFKSYPKQYIRQFVKLILIKLRIIRIKQN